MCRAVRLFLILVSLAVVIPLLHAGPRDEAHARFSEYKFGMFIHWGPYSLASVEASWPIMRPNPKRWHGITESEYRQLYRRFNPVKFNPRAWVELAKAAGQRYMVFTTKHHDGFCMFDSAYTDYKITNTPYGKDIVAELAGACREQKMPLGFYYSPPDMHHPGYRDTSKPARVNWRGEPERPEWFLYLDYMEAQLGELLTRYGDVFVIWFDGLRYQEKYEGWRFHRLIHELSPGTLINNRIGLPGDFGTPEQFLPKGIPTKSSGARLVNTNPNQPGNIASQRVPPLDDFRPWETCMTINHTWAYNKNDRNFKSTTKLIRTLVEVASKGGNFLLNVGPRPDGTIQPEFEERLRGIGKWLEVNGEAIYGTTYGPIQTITWGRTTAKGNTFYLHIFDWPKDELVLDLPKEELKTLRLGTRVARVTLLAGRRPLPFKQKAARLTIQLPSTAPDASASVIAIRMK